MKVSKNVVKAVTAIHAIMVSREKSTVSAALLLLRDVAANLWNDAPEGALGESEFRSEFPTQCVKAGIPPELAHWYNGKMISILVKLFASIGTDATIKQAVKDSKIKSPNGRYPNVLTCCVALAEAQGKRKESATKKAKVNKKASAKESAKLSAKAKETKAQKARTHADKNRTQENPILASLKPMVSVLTLLVSDGASMEQIDRYIHAECKRLESMRLALRDSKASKEERAKVSFVQAIM